MFILCYLKDHKDGKESDQTVLFQQHWGETVKYSKDTKEHVQTKLAKSGVQLGTLYFGHDACAEHYVSL